MQTRRLPIGLPPQTLHRHSDGCGVTGVIVVLGQVDVCVRNIEWAGISGFNELPGDLRKDGWSLGSLVSMATPLPWSHTVPIILDQTQVYRGFPSPLPPIY